MQCLSSVSGQKCVHPELNLDDKMVPKDDVIGKISASMEMKINKIVQEGQVVVHYEIIVVPKVVVITGNKIEPLNLEIEFMDGPLNR